MASEVQSNIVPQEKVDLLEEEPVKFHSASDTEFFTLWDVAGYVTQLTRTHNPNRASSSFSFLPRPVLVAARGASVVGEVNDGSRSAAFARSSRNLSNSAVGNKKQQTLV